MDIEANILNTYLSQYLQFDNIGFSEESEVSTGKLPPREWIQQNLSENSKCNGTIAFQGSARNSRAYFVHLPVKDAKNNLENVYKLITQVWNAETPRFLVSVTGGAKNFSIDEEVLNVFKDIIYKISKQPGAWLISGGTHAGVMKHMGDAMRQDSKAVCIGIATWGIVKNREILCNENDSDNSICKYHVGAWLKAQGAYLNPNHKYFILVDDGEEKYGAEIEFRAELEQHLKQKFNLPFVLIVLGGGPGTFKTVCEAVAGDQKIILMKESGGVADLCAGLLNGEDTTSYSVLKNLINNFEKGWAKCAARKELFTIATKEGDQNIDSMLIRTLLSDTTQEQSEFMKVALNTNSPKILLEQIPINKPDQFYKDTFRKLEDLLICSLAKGNVDFVRILMVEYEVDITDVLSFDVLKLLYGYQSHQKHFPKKHYKKILDDLTTYESNDKNTLKDHMDELCDGNESCKIQNEDNKLLFSKMGIGRLRTSFSSYSQNDFTIIDCSKDGKEITRIIYPLWELFIWANVCNLPEMAKFLWSFEGDQIAKALLAARFWGQMVKKSTYSEQELNSNRENESTFSSLAVGLLDQCFKVDEANAAEIITTTLQHIPDKTCIDLAIEFKNLDFVGHSCVQYVLNDVWTGKLEGEEITHAKDYFYLLLSFFCPFLICKWYKNQSGADQLNHIKTFYLETPVVAFVIQYLSLLLFLIFYSYTNIKEDSPYICCFKEGPEYTCTGPQVIVFLFVLGYISTEIFQVSRYEDDSVLKKIKLYFMDLYSHNYWDLLLLILFIIAFVLRFDLDYYDYSHVLHTIACSLWILRSTTDLRINPLFGQYMEIIKLMLKDLKNFAIMFFFLIFAYGVLSTSLLYRYGTERKPFISLVVRPLLHIFGEFFIDNDETNTTFFGTERYHSHHTEKFKNYNGTLYEEYIVWVALGIYLGGTVILLFNIIVAVFNNRYEEVVNKGRKIWKFNRYHLVVEYSKRVTVPSPFCIIAHVFIFLRWVGGICWSNFRRCRGEKKNEKQVKDDSGLNPELKKIRNEILKTDPEKMIELTESECDRARYIRRFLMDFADGKVNLRGNEKIQDTNETQVEEVKRNKEAVEQTVEELKSRLDSVDAALENIHKLLTTMAQ